MDGIVRATRRRRETLTDPAPGAAPFRYAFPPNDPGPSVELDVRLFAQLQKPVPLLLLAFALEEHFLDFRPDFLERLHPALSFRFAEQQVEAAAQLDHRAHFAGLERKGC